MPTHLPKLKGRSSNRQFGADGSVWCSYLLTGINVDAFRSESIEGAQNTHRHLFESLAKIPSNDMALSGYLCRTPPLQIIERIRAGIPDFDPERYSYLEWLLQPFYAQLQSGERIEKHRLYWLTISKPNPRDLAQMIAEHITEDADPFAGVNPDALDEFDEACFRSIPSAFAPVRADEKMVDWIFRRAISRGLETPLAPPRPSPAAAPPSENAYPQVEIDRSVTADATLEKFAEDVAARRSYTLEPPAKRKFIKAAKRRFKDIEESRVLGFSRPDLANGSEPMGPTSYQTCFAMARYPDSEDDISSFTNIADLATGLDIDFTLRMRFPSRIVDTEQASKTDRDLRSEDQANSKDEFESSWYGKRRQSVRDFQYAISDERAPVGMEVMAIFAAGAPNVDYLSERVDSLLQFFSQHGYEPTLPVGGQFELWQMMNAGSVRTSLGTDLLQPTTARQFSGAIPIRRSWAGDMTGIPFCENQTNALGQIVLLNHFNATEGGNGSIAFTGAPRSGKSNGMKGQFVFLSALNAYQAAIDHSNHGEWAVLGSQVANTDVVYVGHEGNRSLDPLKCLPYPQDETVMRTMYSKLFGLGRYSAEFKFLGEVLKPENRHVYGITSTRNLMNYLARDHTDQAKSLLTRFEYWANMSISRTFIDPVGEDLPPFDDLQQLVAMVEGGHAVATVFRTNGLQVHRGGKTSDDNGDLMLWSEAVYAALAQMTALRFQMIRQLCALHLDEISMYAGNSEVLEPLVRVPNATGAKEKNILITGTQLATDFDEAYDNIVRKVTMRQSTEKNARAALEYADLPTDKDMIFEIMYGTSPLDPSYGMMPAPGTHGQCWWNDGMRTIRAQLYPIMREEIQRYAATEASKMIREADVAELDTSRR